MIVWREKLIAFAIHFLLTLLVAAGAAALIFLVWFPAPFADMLGGTHLFLLVVGCDLVLGPLISLVIYNSKKSRKELFIDYFFVGIVQIAALGYGVWTMASARPAYVVFAVDRLQVIAVNEIDPADVAAATSPYDTIPRWGPKLVALRDASSAEETRDRLFSAMAGKDSPLMPQYYASFDSMRDRVLDRAQPMDTLLERHPEAKPLLDAEPAAKDTSLRWLPVQHRRGAWTALLDPKTAEPVAYIELNTF